MTRPMKRVVTGHDAEGRAIVSISGAPPTIHEIPQIPGTVFYEIWNSTSTPALLDNAPDPTVKALQLKPPTHGSVIRIVDIPPDDEDYLAHGAARMKEAFATIGDAHASTVKGDSPHPLMHRTESLDYGIMIEGELTLVLDRGEEVLRPGDVVVQRGTNHAWANRSGQMVRIAFVLLDGRHADGTPA